MRVVGGSAKGTKLLAVPGDTTRPILDRVKTSLFDILRPEIENVELLLDLFAGSGSVAIEALSQGAKRAIMLDMAPKAISTMRENLKKTHLEGQAEVRKTDAFSYLKNTQKRFDLIYVAPPQYQGLWLEILQLIAERPSLLSGSHAKLIIQIDPKEREPFTSKQLVLDQERKYGNTLLLFYVLGATIHT
ncbi:16S rRNA (guanine(966)-N(2))-methyltransferase RsmD [bacterium]|nr:16S rRNA (guanine(966)-N(2))-methyltransferase RsmD [bacterium]